MSIETVDTRARAAALPDGGPLGPISAHPAPKKGSS